MVDGGDDGPTLHIYIDVNNSDGNLIYFNINVVFDTRNVQQSHA